MARDTNNHVKKTLPPSLNGLPGEAEILYYVKVTVQRPAFYKENFRAVRRLLCLNRFRNQDRFYGPLLIPNRYTPSRFFQSNHPEPLPTIENRTLEDPTSLVLVLMCPKKLDSSGRRLSQRPIHRSLKCHLQTSVLTVVYPIQQSSPAMDRCLCGS